MRFTLTYLGDEVLTTNDITEGVREANKLAAIKQWRVGVNLSDGDVEDGTGIGSVPFDDAGALFEYMTEHVKITMKPTWESRVHNLLCMLDDELENVELGYHNTVFVAAYRSLRLAIRRFKRFF